MRPAIWLLVSFVALASGGVHAEMLSGNEIRAHVAGARIVGVNENESPYTIWLYPRGGMKGLLGKKRQFDDHGRWWVKGDRLCMHWELWLLGKPTCYEIDLTGDEMTRIVQEQRVYIRATLVR